MHASGKDPIFRLLEICCKTSSEVTQQVIVFLSIPYLASMAQISQESALAEITSNSETAELTPPRTAASSIMAEGDELAVDQTVPDS